jgi:hypothetical protein
VDHEMMEHLLHILLEIHWRDADGVCHRLFALNIGMEFAEKSKMPFADT